jgi:hypothetical protein
MSIARQLWNSYQVYTGYVNQINIITQNPLKLTLNRENICQRYPKQELWVKKWVWSYLRFLLGVLETAISDPTEERRADLYLLEEEQTYPHIGAVASLHTECTGETDRMQRVWVLYIFHSECSQILWNCTYQDGSNWRSAGIANKDL